jgi:hypothetical protein
VNGTRGVLVPSSYKFFFLDYSHRLLMNFYVVNSLPFGEDGVLLGAEKSSQEYLNPITGDVQTQSRP